MAFIWGSTWVPAKLALGEVPPVLLAGIRFVPAGLVLLGLWRWRGGRIAVARADWGRLALVGLLTTTISYAVMFWAMQYIRTGFAAIVDFTAVPVFLLAFAVLSGEEQFHRRQAMAVVLGCCGLVALFLPSMMGEAVRGPREGLAAAGVVVSVAAYCWGSVLARPLLRRYSSLFISGITCLAGGLVLIGLSLLIEPRAAAAINLTTWSLPVLASWAYLFLAGTVVAATIFLVLVREWGPSRAGSFAFVSPAIAVWLGWLAFDERFGLLEIIGMAIMLAATYLALNRPAANAPAAAE